MYLPGGIMDPRLGGKRLRLQATRSTRQKRSNFRDRLRAIPTAAKHSIFQIQARFRDSDVAPITRQNPSLISKRFCSSIEQRTTLAAHRAKMEGERGLVHT